MSMRLGFDLDEVVVNLADEFETHLELNYGIVWPAECFTHFDFRECVFHQDVDLDAKITTDMIEVANDPEFQSQAKPMPGARESIQKLKRIGHKIYFITSRPKDNKPATIKWLRQNDIPFDEVEVIGHDEPKGRYGMHHRLDMFVDDLEKHLLSMWSYKNKWRKGLLLLTRPWNYKSIDASKFKRVDDWNNILRHVGVANR